MDTAMNTQTAAVVTEEKYTWFSHTGKQVRMRNKSKTLLLNPGDVYGVRFSNNKKFIRLITKLDGPTVVYTLTTDTAKQLGKSAKARTKMETEGKPAKVNFGAMAVAIVAIWQSHNFDPKVKFVDPQTLHIKGKTELGSYIMSMQADDAGKFVYVDAYDDSGFSADGIANSLDALALVPSDYADIAKQSKLFAKEAANLRTASDQLMGLVEIIPNLHKALEETFNYLNS